jgi:haloacid dehalogenase-like hydrolase
MSRKLIPMAIAYDFDGTLASGNIQENSFLPALGMRKADFWKQNKARAAKHEADEILSYMTFMLEQASAKDVPVRREDFARHGKTVPLFQGAVEWFDRVNARAKERHVKLQHFIISSGIKEMIEATKIGKKFVKVFASSFAYDANGAAKWPALAINYTTKTQYLFRINKGSLSVHEPGLVNDFVPHEDRPMPSPTLSSSVTVKRISRACACQRSRRSFNRSVSTWQLEEKGACREAHHRQAR